MITINCNTSGKPTDTPYILSDGGEMFFGKFLEEGRIQFTLSTKTPPAGWGATVLWNKDQNQARTVIPVKFGAYEGGLLDPPIPTISYASPVIIPTFTRSQICNPQITLSGLTIATSQFKIQPWFEIAWQCLSSAEDRLAVLEQKKLAGDKAQIIEFYTYQKHIYRSDSWLNDCITEVGEFNPAKFFDFVTEILVAGLVPVVVFDGDNGDNPSDGYPNALRQLPILTSILAPYNSKILYARFWDGVFYGSEPSNIQNFGRTFRQLLPQGNLAIEFNPGHIPVGNGPDDYQPNGMMIDYDVVAGEFEFPEYRQDSTWQICARLLPNYKRPTDQPRGDDPNPPFYLKTGNPRGQYYFWAFEAGEYQWVRNRVSLKDLKTAGTYFRNMNCYNVGFPG